MATLSGHHPLQMLVTKIIRSGGSLSMILQKIFAGNCCHSKMKLSYGRKLVKRIAITLGKAAMSYFYVKQKKKRTDIVRTG